MSYWANAFFEDKGLGYSCTVITAIPQEKKQDSIIYVEDKKGLWINRFFEGISWVPALKAFFNSISFDYDYVVISGGPFGHFWITRYLKKNFKCKVILDFRDPFSRNSRFKTFFIKDYLKVWFERSFLTYADHVITVNDYCKNLLLQSVSRKEISIIENGYDEKTLDNIVTDKFNDGLIHIVYAGSFYQDRNPTMFVKQLLEFSKQNKKFVLHHIGSPSEFLQESRGSDAIHEHGEKTYKQTLEIMKKCTIGLIITSGEPMESTTKIYDYIGCELDIVVITNGVVRTGSIHGITSNVEEKVAWVSNTEEEILHFLESYTDKALPIKNKGKFSRQQGHKMLMNILQGL